MTGGRKLPSEVLAQIVAKTDGVPLFVEELTKNVLESGLLIEDDERYRLDGPLPPLAIPSTLQDSLMARLDRLAAVKEIAQIGAAIGREFSYALLQAVVGRDEATLRASLTQLEESELVFRGGEPPAARYTFKHALVQDTAYECLLKSRRQILHQRIAEALRDKFPEVVEAEPELIAEHYTRAGLTEPAIVHWGKAGDLALRRSAFKEAIAHLGKAIEMTEVGDTQRQREREAPAVARQRLKLQTTYGQAVMWSKGYVAEETKAALERVEELATEMGDAEASLDTYHARWAHRLFRAEFGSTRETAEGSFELRAALALARLYQSTGRPVEAHDVLGPALEGFSPTPEFPEIAEAKALFEALAEIDEVKLLAASRRQRARLHVSYGAALMAARGHSAPDVTATFERARELAAAANPDEKFAATFGLWVGCLVRGELAKTREWADVFLREALADPSSAEAGVGHRIKGTTHWFAGEFVEAREQLQRALAVFDPERDRDLALRFGYDGGVVAAAYLLLVLWPLGEFELARRLFGEMSERLMGITHAGTVALATTIQAVFELTRRDFDRVAPFAAMLGDLARDREMDQWKVYGHFLEGWRQWRAGDRDAGLAAMRGGLSQLAEQKFALFEGTLHVALAEAEAEAVEIEKALATIDHAIGEALRTGQRWWDAELHRTRGEILLKQNPADPVPAVAALLTAIEIARQQKARSFELRAALSLAKLYSATGRDADAHDALGPALEGFSPTQEFPEIAEAMEFVATIRAAREQS